MLIPTKICWLNISGKFPVGMRIPPLRVKIMFESNPLKSRILVGRLALRMQVAAGANGNEPSWNRPGSEVRMRTAAPWICYTTILLYYYTTILSYPIRYLYLYYTIPYHTILYPPPGPVLRLLDAVAAEEALHRGHLRYSLLMYIMCIVFIHCLRCFRYQWLSVYALFINHDIYIYIYIHTYICMYICIYIYIYIYICIHS